MTPEHEALRYAAWDYRTNANPGTAAAFHRACTPELIEAIVAENAELSAQVEAQPRKLRAAQGLADERYAEVLELTAQLIEAQAVPGWQMVPLEPTPEMVGAPSTIIQAYGARLIYQRMLAAAPIPGAPAQAKEDAT